MICSVYYYFFQIIQQETHRTRLGVETDVKKIGLKVTGTVKLISYDRARNMVGKRKGKRAFSSNSPENSSFPLFYTYTATKTNKPFISVLHYPTNYNKLQKWDWI